jgi:hypothetical protein
MLEASHTAVGTADRSPPTPDATVNRSALAHPVGAPSLAPLVWKAVNRCLASGAELIKMDTA